MFSFFSAVLPDAVWSLLGYDEHGGEAAPAPLPPPQQQKHQGGDPDLESGVLAARRDRRGRGTPHPAAIAAAVRNAPNTMRIPNIPQTPSTPQTLHHQTASPRKPVQTATTAAVTAAAATITFSSSPSMPSMPSMPSPATHKATHDSTASSFTLTDPSFPAATATPPATTAEQPAQQQHCSSSMWTRVVEVQFYLGPQEGDIIGLRDAETARRMAHSTGGQKNPVQFASMMISAAAAENQAYLMTNGNCCATSDHHRQSSSLFSAVSSSSSYSATSSEDDAHHRTPSIAQSAAYSRGRRRRRRRRARDPSGWNLSYKDSAPAERQPPSTLPMASVAYDHHALWHESQPWLEMSMSQESDVAPPAVTLFRVKTAQTNLSRASRSAASSDASIGTIYMGPLLEEIRLRNHLASDRWLPVHVHKNQTDAAVSPLIFARVQVLLGDTSEVTCGPSSRSRQDLFEDAILASLPAHDKYGMPLEEGPQRRMYSVMESYDELLESLCRQRWSMVHPSNLFRDVNDHNPFLTAILATSALPSGIFSGGGGGSSRGTGIVTSAASATTAAAAAAAAPNRRNARRLDAPQMIRSSSLGQSPLLLQNSRRRRTGGGSSKITATATGPVSMYSDTTTAPPVAVTAAEKVSELIWELGIPTDRRKAVYMLLSGAAAHARHHGSEHYRMLVRRSDRPGGLHSVDAAQIDVDIPRTFARRLSVQRNDKNVSGMADVDIASPLRRVLRAFATSHRAVGYCQAMNFIAARFLLLTDSNARIGAGAGRALGEPIPEHEEEDAYWLLVAVCTKLCPGYYVPSMTGTMADIRVVQDLLHARLPSVAGKVRRLGVPLEGVVSNWLLTLFSGGGRNGMSLRVSQRVLDVLMLEGCNALVAVTFAVFELAQEDLLRCGSISRFIEVLSGTVRGLTDAGPLLRSARKILQSVGPHQLNNARRMVTVEVTTEAEARMKGKLHRKCSCLDDTAFEEAYAHFQISSQRAAESGGRSSTVLLKSSFLQDHGGSSIRDVGFRAVQGDDLGASGRGVVSRDDGTGYDYSYIDYRSLDLASFRELMLELKPQWIRDLSGLDRLFVAFDADHNGAIDVHEFMQGLQALSQVGSRTDKLRMLFLAYDSRGVGRLSKLDIACLLRTTNAMLDRSAAKVFAGGESSDEMMVYTAAADAILQTICEVVEENGAGGTAGDLSAAFEQFLKVPDLQPDVLRTVVIKLPFASRKIMLSLRAKREAAEVVEAERAARVREKERRNAAHLPRSRKPSQEELQLLRTSPR